MISVKKTLTYIENQAAKQRNKDLYENCAPDYEKN